MGAQQAEVAMAQDLHKELEKAYKLIGTGELDQAKEVINKTLHFYFNDELDNMLKPLYFKIARKDRNSKGSLQDELKKILNYLKSYEKFEKNDKVRFVNKVSGSEYDGTVLEVYNNYLLVCNDFQEYKIFFKLWNVTKITEEVK